MQNNFVRCRLLLSVQGSRLDLAQACMQSKYIGSVAHTVGLITGLSMIQQVLSKTNAHRK